MLTDDTGYLHGGLEAIRACRLCDYGHRESTKPPFHEDKIRFIIRVEVARQAGLTVSAKLLQLADQQQPELLRMATSL